MAPSPPTPGAAEAARETLAGATAAAERLPAPLGADPLDPAHEAFTGGLNVVAAVLVYAALALVLLGRVRPGGDAEAAAVAVTTEGSGRP